MRRKRQAHNLRISANCWFRLMKVLQLSIELSRQQQPLQFCLICTICILRGFRHVLICQLSRMEVSHIFAFTECKHHDSLQLKKARTKLVREGGLEDESIVNKDLQVHLERYLHPGSPHLSHSAPWKDFGLLQPAYQMLTVIDQPIRNHRANEESVQSFRLQDSLRSKLRYAHRISQCSTQADLAL